MWANGYAKSRRIFLANARIRALSVYADGRSLGRVGLDDQMGLQWSTLPAATATEYRFVVETVYPGSKYADVCVTEILRDRRSAEGYALADALARAAGNRALSEAEIREEYRAMYHFYRSFFDDKGLMISSDRAFWDAVVLRASVRDQGSLRFMLNLRYHAGGQRTVPVELLEGLRDLVISYFEDADASVVADVWQDKDQAGRDAIESAYVMFVDPWSPEQVRKYRKKNAGFDRITDLFCNEIAVNGGDKAHFCQGD